MDDNMFSMKAFFTPIFFCNFRRIICYFSNKKWVGERDTKFDTIYEKFEREISKEESTIYVGRCFQLPLVQYIFFKILVQERQPHDKLICRESPMEDAK